MNEVSVTKKKNEDNLKLAKKNKSIFFAKTVGMNLKSARKSIRFSQKYVAEKIGVDETQISHFESGRRIPSLIHFQQLCNLYKVKPQDILATNVSHIGGKLATDFDLNEVSEGHESDDICHAWCI